MNNKLLRVAALLLCAALALACKKDELIPEPASDYTVIVYAAGGGNLDSFLQSYINEISQVKRDEKINFACLIKFSKGIQDSEAYPEEMKGTVYIDNTYTPSRYAGADFEMYKPENITAYINKVAADYPAKKYIFVLWNHGLSISELDVPLSKAVLQDDNLDGAVVTPYQMEAGIKASTIGKFDLIYADLCMNNNIEIDYQMSTVTDYYMASANPGVAGASDYALFFDCLSSEPTLEAAMTAYIQNLTSGKWVEANQLKWSMDLSLLDLRKIGPVISTFKKVSARYIELYKASDAGLKADLDKIQRSGDERVYPMIAGKDSEGNDLYCVWPSDGSFYYYNNQLPIAWIQRAEDGSLVYPEVHTELYTCTDLYASFFRLSERLNDKRLSDSLKQMKAAIDDMVLCSGEREAPEWLGERALISLLWVTKDRYNGHLFCEEGYEAKLPTPLRSTYPHSRFCAETGWSSYFELYQATYPSYLPAKLSDWGL